MSSVGVLLAVAAEILWTRPICVETNRYIGWPTVCVRKSGELMVVFSGDRDAHVCPFGKVQLVRSMDNGETWSLPQTIRNSSMDDRDAGLIELADGTLLVNFFSSSCYKSVAETGRKAISETYRRVYEKIPEADAVRDTGYFSMRSTDGGKSWGEFVRMKGSANHGGIQLRDGRVLVVGRRWNSQGNFHETDPASKGRVHELLAEISDDDGLSWNVLSRIRPQPPYAVTDMHEPHVVELDDGTLIVHLRCHGGNRRTVQCESRDGGRTWSPVHETGIRGYPSHLLRLKDGGLLSTYASRDAGRYGEYVCVSFDGGKSWNVKDELCLTRHFNGDLGYPSTVELSDGTLVTVYYQARQQGEKPCLMATKWRFKPERKE